MSSFNGIPTFEIDEGVNLPSIGVGCAFGNWVDPSRFFGFTPEQAWSAIPMALEADYRHLDCARVYGSHRHVRDSLRAAFASGMLKDRKDIFITTKLFHDTAPIVLSNIENGVCMTDPKWINEPGALRARILLDFEKSIDDLGVGYVDLLLVHWPGSPENTSETNKILRKEVWSAFEEIHAKKWARAIGVSNHTQAHVEEILSYCTVKPVVNQLEVNPYYYRPDLINWMQSKGIHVMAWGPLGSGGTGLLQDETLISIGKKYGKDVGQVVLRWLNQHNIASLPKSSSAKRLKSNLNIFDFSLTSEEMAAIDGLNKGLSSVAGNPIEKIP